MTPVQTVIFMLRKYPDDLVLLLDLLDKLYQQELDLRGVGVEPRQVAVPRRNDDPDRFDGLTFAVAAKRILQEIGRPASAMEIAKHAANGGYRPGSTIEQLRSSFAAIISKDIRESSPTFVLISRGQIGLTESARLELNEATKTPVEADVPLTEAL